MFELDEIVTFKKPHPCGGVQWKVKRSGVDLKLECTTCGHVIEIKRMEAIKRLKTK